MIRSVLLAALLALVVVGCGPTPAKVDAGEDAGTGGGDGGGAGGGIGGGGAVGGGAGGGAGGGVGGGASGGGAGGGVGGGSGGGGDPDGGPTDGGDTDGGPTDGGDTDGGETDGGTDGGFDGGVIPSTLCLDVAKKRCDFYIRCRTDVADNAGRTNDQVAASERAKCEATFANDRSCTVGAAGWSNGRATLDVQKYNECVDATYPAATCVRDINDAQKKCLNAPFVTPITVPGGDCTADNECVNGFCQVPAGSICGTCQTWLNADGGVGPNCQRDSQCDPGKSFCFNTQNPCRAYTALNSTCNFISTNQEECGPGNVCMATAGTTNNPRCRVGKLEGVACTKGRLECYRSGRGQFELVCATDALGNNTCQKRFNTAPAARCGTGEAQGGTVLGTLCQETEFCAAGLCANRRDAGVACNNIDQCQAGNQCLGNTCTPFRGLDAGCAGSASCQNLLGCIQGTCQPSSSLLDGGCGLTGAVNVACAEGFCNSNGATDVCAPLLADGQACATFAECESYSCVNNLCAKACWKP